MRAEWATDIYMMMSKHEITQVELAKKIGWSRQHLCAVLHGRRRQKNDAAKYSIIGALNEIVEERRNAEGEAE